jgi:hypothetical protein
VELIRHRDDGRPSLAQGSGAPRQTRGQERLQAVP